MKRKRLDKYAPLFKSTRSQEDNPSHPFYQSYQRQGNINANSVLDYEAVLPTGRLFETLPRNTPITTPRPPSGNSQINTNVPRVLELIKEGEPGYSPRPRVYGANNKPIYVGSKAYKKLIEGGAIPPIGFRR
jgi:hypothetical protein